MKTRETNIFKTIRNGLCFFLLVGAVACNGDTEMAETEVADNDVVTEEVAVADTWDEDAYYTNFTAADYYANWDVDNDNFLSEEEFAASFYEIWDLNNDGRVSQGEWNRVTADYGNSIDATDWQAWDTDGDGFMERAEFDADFPEMGWHDAWDMDNDSLLTDREYAAGTFKIWDKNNDNVLDETEYEHYNTYYGM